MGFASFLGNARAVETVRGMLRNGRVPGTLLFSGPDGVGKKTLALMLAKALSCERPGPRGDDFCGECSRCRKAEAMIAHTLEDLDRRRDIKQTSRRVEGLTYFDLQLIEPLTRYTLIEQIRQLRQVAYTRPFELPYRVFVIDQAQAIHWQAADLLLKVVEEPPETTKLILICPNRYELRPTLRSRSVHLRFFPVEEFVIDTLVGGGRRLTQARRALAARVVRGSIARAKAFDPDDFEERRRLWVDFLDGVAGRVGEVDWKRVFDSTRGLAEKRDAFEETLRMGLSLVRDLMVVLLEGAEAEVVNLDLLPRLRAWSRGLGLGGIDQLHRGLEEAYRLQTRNVNQQLGLDALAVDVGAGGGERRGQTT